MRHQDQFIAMAISDLPEYKLKSGIITDEAGAMQWAASKAEEMRLDGAASPIREVTVRRWEDRPVWDRAQAKLVYQCPPLFVVPDR